MNAHSRTLLTVICEAALEKRLLADLEALGAPGWTISDARGRGHRGVRSAGWGRRCYRLYWSRACRGAVRWRSNTLLSLNGML